MSVNDFILPSFCNESNDAAKAVYLPNFICYTEGIGRFVKGGPSMTAQQLDSFLFDYTKSEIHHRSKPFHTLSQRYQRIPRVTFEGREIYLFSFNSLLENRSICANKESRFTSIPEHIHTVIEFLYVYAGNCTQIINGQRIKMSRGDICLLDTNVPHSIEYLNDSDIVITIEMRKEYLTQGFLQRLGDNAIINNFLIRALSEDTAHDQYLLFRQRKDNPIHSIIQNILCEYYDPQLCSDRAIDACIVLLCCEILRHYRDQTFSACSNDANQIVKILEYIEKNYLTTSLQSAAAYFGFHPNYLSSYIKKQTGYSFKELMIFQRMYQASFLLINTDIPIYKIAEKVGYSNLGFFYRKFTSVYQMSPAQWREEQHSAKLPRTSDSGENS